MDRGLESNLREAYDYVRRELWERCRRRLPGVMRGRRRGKFRCKESEKRGSMKRAIGRFFHLHSMSAKRTEVLLTLEETK